MVDNEELTNGAVTCNETIRKAKGNEDSRNSAKPVKKEENKMQLKIEIK
jgi:hypothetical protein